MIRIQKKPKLKNPVFIAAWPGMGKVALKAAGYLKDKLKAEVFAEFDPGKYFSPQEAYIKNGIIELPKLPVGKFYFWKNKHGKSTCLSVKNYKTALILFIPMGIILVLIGIAVLK